MNTIHISSTGNLWQVFTETGPVSRKFILKSLAVAKAVAYVGSMPAGSITSIEMENMDGTYKTIWTYSKENFPPKRIALRLNKFMR